MTAASMCYSPASLEFVTLCVYLSTPQSVLYSGFCLFDTRITIRLYPEIGSKTYGGWVDSPLVHNKLSWITTLWKHYNLDVIYEMLDI